MNRRLHDIAAAEGAALGAATGAPVSRRARVEALRHRGLSLAQIAARLALSEATVRAVAAEARAARWAARRARGLAASGLRP